MKMMDCKKNRRTYCINNLECSMLYWQTRQRTAINHCNREDSVTNSPLIKLCNSPYHESDFKKGGTLRISEFSQQLFCLDANDERITSNHICCEEEHCFGLSVYLTLRDSERQSHTSSVKSSFLMAFVFLSDPWPSVDFPYMCRIKVR